MELKEDLHRLTAEKSDIESKANKEIDNSERDKRIGKLIEESFSADTENTEEMREVFQ